LSAVFVARDPLPDASVPGRDAPVQFVDDSFSRKSGEISDALRIRFKRFFDLPSPPYTKPKQKTGFESLKAFLRGR
jgi:hypothetical protein